MNATLQKVALALKAANEECYAAVRYNSKDDVLEILIDGVPVEANFKDWEAAEDRCETLNYEYAARKAVEALADYNFSHGDSAVLEFLDTFIKYAR